MLSATPFEAEGDGRFRVSERRACVLTRQHRSSQRYRRRLVPEEALLRERLRLLARHHPRFGYRRVHALPRRDGRYQRYVDHPDEIVVRRRAIFPRRRRAIPFSAVETVSPQKRTVVLRLDQSALERSIPV